MGKAKVSFNINSIMRHLIVTAKFRFPLYRPFF